MSRPQNDLCGPVQVSGTFDRTAMGLENHGFILGEIRMTGPVASAAYIWAGKHAVDTFSCKSVAGPDPEELLRRPKS